MQAAALKRAEEKCTIAVKKLASERAAQAAEVRSGLGGSEDRRHELQGVLDEVREELDAQAAALKALTLTLSSRVRSPWSSR